MKNINPTFSALSKDSIPESTDKPLFEFVGIFMEEEIWKNIPEYDGYQASNLGRIKALRKVRIFGKYADNKRTYPEVIMKQRITNNGYCMVSFCIDGKNKYLTVHRLVGKTFIPNPENKATINHKNGIKTDNRVENLEWNTCSENLKHAYRIGLSYSLFSVINPSSRKVIDTKTNIVYPTIANAAMENNISIHSLYRQLSGRFQNNTSFKKI